MKRQNFKKIKDNSRPGYQLYECEDGFKFWARILSGKESRWYDNAETSEVTHEQLVAMGGLKGMKPKCFSEMSKEEQKLFTNHDNS